MYRKPVRFAYTVPVSTSGELSRQVDEPCTLERMIVRFPPGPAGDLRVTCYIQRPDGYRQNVVLRDGSGTGNDYLAGDDFTFDYKISLPVPAKSYLVVGYSNVDANNTHFFDVSFELDELGGVLRAEVS